MLAAAAASTFATTIDARDIEPRPLAGKLLTVGGRGVWVEDYGPRKAPTLLYVHGGPGLGGYEFSHFMRDALSVTMRVIMVDQRGVLRSDALASTDVVNYAALASDFESVREALGIRRWAVLGHSWGGPIALHYANEFRNSVSHLIFENPVLDPATTGTNMLGWAAVALACAGKRAESETVRALAEEATPIMWQRMDAALGLLPTRQALYVYNPAFLGYYGRITADSRIPEVRWEQGITFGERLFAEEATFASAWGAMSALRQPTLLVRGQFDPATSPLEVAHMVAKPNVRLLSVPACSHFVHVERPDALAGVIMKLVAG